MKQTLKTKNCDLLWLMNLLLENWLWQIHVCQLVDNFTCLSAPIDLFIDTIYLCDLSLYQCNWELKMPR